MTFSYTSPGSCPKDAVRFYAKDTVATTYIVEDEEIEYLLEKTSNVKLVAAEVADVIRAHFARLASFKVGDISKDYSKAADAYAELAKDLRREAHTLAGVSFPATKTSTKQTLEDNTDLPAPHHRIGQGDNLRAMQLDRDGDDTDTV